MTWTELRQAILDSHKPIQHLFFRGLGNRLQFEDSNMAEGIMLHFVKEDVQIKITKTLVECNDDFSLLCWTTYAACIVSDERPREGYRTVSVRTMPNAMTSSM